MNPILFKFLEEQDELLNRLRARYTMFGKHMGSGYWKNDQQFFWFPWQDLDEEDTSIEELHYDFPEAFKTEPLLKVMGEWTNGRECLPIEWVEIAVQRAYDHGYSEGFERAEEKIAERRRERDEP